MIKVIVAVKKRSDLSVEDFQKHWQTTHAELVNTNPATKKYVRKYIQCHTLPSEYQRGEVAYDGTAELWFDSLEDKDAFFTDGDYIASIQPDESRFADMSNTAFFITEEKTIFDNTGR